MGIIMVRFVSTLLVAMFALAGAASEQSLPIPSTWQNERGSVMKALKAGTSGGAFSGVYINNAAGFKCRGTPYDLTGEVDGTRVTFTVVWKNAAADCHSTAVWRGQITGRTLATTWTLTRQ